MDSVADLIELPALRGLAEPGEVPAGIALADAAAVERAAFGPLQVKATVSEGWDERTVELRSVEGGLRWACDCPAGTVGQFCRHAVAAAVVTWRRAPARQGHERRP